MGQYTDFFKRQEPLIECADGEYLSLGNGDYGQTRHFDYYPCV